jgi:hypothetical protein
MGENLLKVVCPYLPDQTFLSHLKGTKAVADSLNKSLCLAPTLGVTKFIKTRDKILVTLCCAT